MFTSVFCEKIIPTKKVISRHIKDVCNLDKTIQRGFGVAAFIFAVIADAGIEKIGHGLCG